MNEDRIQPPAAAVHSVAGLPWFEAAATKAVFTALNADGHETRAVGGAVRNSLMGLPVHEVDFATTASPEEVTALARAAGLKAVPTGLKHGTVTIVADRQPFEVTTLRQDVETFGRHASVKFTRDWAMDASRRDFTINALYAGADGAVHDPLGGYPDLEARRVRFIGSARDRIREDFLRILRFFRFTADYGREPDPEGYSACLAERAGLSRLSAERVRVELLRILVTREPMRAIEAMGEGGLLTLLLGGVARAGHAERMIAVEAANGLPGDALRRLAALAVMVEEDATRLGARLRLSNAEAARLQAMAALKPALSSGMSELAAKTALYRVGKAPFVDRLLLAWARTSAGPEDAHWRAHLSLPERWPIPVFPLTGEDLLGQGFERGPRLGETLRRLESEWIASDFSLSRDDLLKLTNGRAAID
jgi:tRNA nucleotidyltransferase/poly(A) polymerase